jgi:hypothetical protein
VQPFPLPDDSPFIVEADRQVDSPPLLPEDSPFIVEADWQVDSPPSCLRTLPLLWRLTGRCLKPQYPLPLVTISLYGTHHLSSFRRDFSLQQMQNTGKYFAFFACRASFITDRHTIYISLGNRARCKLLAKYHKPGNTENPIFCILFRLDQENLDFRENYKKVTKH